MKALLLAAGLGTRLKPFTETKPKALFEVDGKTLLEHSIDHFKQYGIKDIIINVHHFSEQIIDYLKHNRNFDINISLSDETGQLLETGGGLKKAAWFFEDGKSFLVRNTDVLSDLDLNKLMDQHHKQQGLATLVVRERETLRYFLFDDEMRLCGWENKKSGKKIISREEPSDRGVIERNQVMKQLAFSGIQIIDPKIFNLITETGKFSLTDLYLRLSRSQVIYGYLDRESYWRDAGK